MVVSVQGQTCGVIGTDHENEDFDADRTHGFYLNTQDPAPCDGTVDKFKYCYFRHNSLGAIFTDSFAFKFAVYRETSLGSYSPVSETFIAVRESNIADAFDCLIYPVSNQIQIQAGDVIGACIYDPPGGRRETFVVGQHAGADRYLMTTSTPECDDSTLPDHVSSLASVNSQVLLISADISE